MKMFPEFYPTKHDILKAILIKKSEKYSLLFHFIKNEWVTKMNGNNCVIPL